jgi:hypothetical protein
MHIADPDYINSVLAFSYHGLTIQITACQHQERTVYTAWVDYATGSAVAVPQADSRDQAIRRAKIWIQQKFELG